MAAHLNAIGTALPPYDIHATFLAWARGQVAPASARLFDRAAARAGIAHRWSVLGGPDEPPPIGPGGFYADPFPGTAARMERYAAAAPALALAAVAALGEQGIDVAGATHLVVASCTGFVAPGIDQLVAAALGLAPDVERLLVGFMGCYAAVAALRSARHIVRSDPDARVLVVTVELCTLHMRDEDGVEPLLAMLQFGDGAAAAWVSAAPAGFVLDRPFAAALPDTAELIRWTITDQGFAMHLSGAVPGRIGAALAEPAAAARLLGGDPAGVDAWAVHAGGRSILDAVAGALHLDPRALDASRAVLDRAGNMSSATLMFVLASLLARPAPVRRGVALAFGPGLAAEGFGFRSAG